MRVMVLVPGDRNSEAGLMPDEKLLAGMMKFNEELVKAGVMLAGEGLTPTSKGARVRFDGDSRTVVRGPFDSKDIVAGFWMWNVKSLDEAIEWIKRAPFGAGTQIELRPVFETEDFGDAMTPEMRAKEDELRAKVESQKK